MGVLSTPPSGWTAICVMPGKVLHALTCDSCCLPRQEDGTSSLATPPTSLLAQRISRGPRSSDTLVLETFI